MQIGLMKADRNVGKVMIKTLLRLLYGKRTFGILQVLASFILQKNLKINVDEDIFSDPIIS